MLTVTELKRADTKALKEIRHLLAELRSDSSEHKGSLADLRNLVGDKKAALLVVKDGTRIVGMATLYCLTKVGKRIGYVEDVVVGSAYRGQGLGEKLMRSVIAAGRKKKLKNLFLTSRPSRAAANKLYAKLGFEIVETNPYKLTL